MPCIVDTGCDASGGALREVDTNAPARALLCAAPCDPTKETPTSSLQELPPTEYAVAIASSTEVCPEFTSNVFSQLSFSWLTPLMRKGYAHPLEFNDIWELPPPDKVKEVHNELDRNWRKQLETGAHPILRPQQCATCSELCYGRRYARA